MRASAYRSGHPSMGFTLIELLVIIAMIAILAGILFPVFSQARAQARKVTCLSHQKQVALSLLMYCQDYDETLPPWANGKLNAVTLTRSCTIGSWQEISYWTQLVLPYGKHWQVFTCPENGHARDSDYLQMLGYPAHTTGLLLEHCRACFPDFGYNQHYLSPLKANSIFTGTPLAAIERPSHTLLGTDSSGSLPYSNTEVGQNYVDAPTVSRWTMTGSSLWYGNVAPRHHHHANVAFADGHAKSLTLSALTQGSDPVNSLITDPDAYLWDLR